jgi:phosphohistidine swiveling domain-containing protein
MSLFKKLGEAPKLFSKVFNDPTLFRKISNTARKIDNSVARVGNFLTSTAKNIGLGSIAPRISGVTDAVHNIRNGLEKAISAPINEVRQYN